MDKAVTFSLIKLEIEVENVLFTTGHMKAMALSLFISETHCDPDQVKAMSEGVDRSYTANANITSFE